MNKRIFHSASLRLFLAISVMIACLILIPVSAMAASNSCGEDVKYELSDGVLTITGTGDMTDFSSTTSVPWNEDQNSITEVIIEEGITSVGKNAFYGSDNIKSIRLPSTLTAINANAFRGCASLTEIILPENVTVIGTSAFRSCSELNSLALNNALANIGSYAFYECTALSEVTIPGTVASIEVNTFGYCTNLKNVIIENGLTEISSDAFRNAKNLEKIEIPKSVTSINVNAFRYCDLLNIWGYANSAAQTFAEEQNIPFYYSEKTLPGSLSNFTSNITYNGFDDVNSTSWYSDNVKKAVEIGLMKGLNASTFNPSGNLTLAETITLASRIHSIYYTGTDSFVSGSPWYQPYVDYAVKNGIIIMKYDYTKAATRAQFAEIMASALPDEALPVYNVTDDDIPDVSISDYASEDIYKLYRAGIIGGNENGKFLPNNSITRAEASAIVARMAVPDQRLGYDPEILIKDTPVAEDPVEDDELVFGNLNYFESVDTYKGFSDVKSTSWYYENVKSAVEIDLMEGVSANSFNPSGNLTIGQAVALASRIHSIYYTGSQSFTLGNPWYKVYVEYALENEIINQVYDYTKPATRAEFTEIMAGALPETALPAYNEVTDGDIPDVSIAEGDYVAEEIYMLYRAGIIGGNTEGYFLPDNTITRAEASAILTRIAIPDQRLGYDPFISTGDDSKKVIFRGKTVDDFPSELVVNFDEVKNNNFGVLSEDIICLDNTDNVNLVTRLDDGTYVIANPDDTSLNLKFGDVVKTVDEAGNIVLFKVDELEIDGTTLSITPASGTMLSEYYQYLKVNTTATVGSVANARAAESSVSEGGSSPNITIIPGGLEFGAKLDNDNYTLGLTGKVMIDFKIDIEYDPVLFGEDYFYMDVKNTTTSTVSLTGSLKAGKESGILTDELDLGRLPVQTTIPGVEIELELTLPIKFEAEASITGALKIEQYNRYNYCNEYGWITDEAQDKDADVEIKGKVTGSIGPKLDLKLAFLDDVMELGVEGNLKVQLTAETETAESEDPTGMKESIHKCDLCINGDLDGIFNIEFVLSLCVSEKTKLELVKYTFVEVKVHIADFYVSLVNDADSIHKGQLAFELFKECPNRDYRVQFKLVSADSGDPVEEVMDVFVNASDGSGSHTIPSDEHLYLKAGHYGACVVGNEDLGVPFLIQTKPLVVTVKAPEADERSIYNKYLVNEGFDNLNVISDMNAKYMEISTILVDLGGDERKELVLKAVNTRWAGPRGYETQYYLFTINSENEVVPVADCYYSGGTMGGDDMFVYVDSVTGKPIAAMDSAYRDGIYANTVGRYIYTFNGSTANFTSAYLVNRRSIGTHYDDQIAAVKKATKYYTVDENNYFTYWTDLNDKYISEATYNSGYDRYQKSSKYDWVAGTVSVPIPKTE